MQNSKVDFVSNTLERGRIIVRSGPVGYLLVGLGEGAVFLQQVLEGKTPSIFFKTCRDIGDAIKTDGEVVTRQFGLSSSLADISEEPLRRLAIAEALLKAGFNPDEPRDERGRWTSEGANPQITTLPEPNEVAYHGDYHDQLVQEYAAITRESSGVAVTSVPLTSPSGVTAVADLVVRPKGWPEPFVLEVKTGDNPSLTPNQGFIYALLPVGNHLVSSKKDIESLGLPVGTPLPPLRLLVVYVYRPGALIQYIWWPPLPEE